MWSLHWSQQDCGGFFQTGKACCCLAQMAASVPVLDYDVELNIEPYLQLYHSKDKDNVKLYKQLYKKTRDTC